MSFSSIALWGINEAMFAGCEHRKFNGGIFKVRFGINLYGFHRSSSQVIGGWFFWPKKVMNSQKARSLQWRFFGSAWGARLSRRPVSCTCPKKMPKQCVETWKYWGQIESFWHPGNTRDPFFWVAILRVPVFVAEFKIYQFFLLGHRFSAGDVFICIGHSIQCPN